MKFNHYIFCFIAIAICTAAWWLLKLQYYSRAKIMNNCEVLWNTNEAYVKIGKEVDFVAGTLPKIGLRQFNSLMSFQEDIKEESTLVWHLKKADTRFLGNVNIKSGGGMFPFKGNMYYTVGVESVSDWPALWCVTNSDLKKVNQTQAEYIVKSFTNRDQIIMSEGWHRKECDFIDGEVILPLPLATNDLSLILSQSNTGVSQTRAIILQTSSNREVLLKINDVYHMIKRSEYPKPQLNRTSSP